MRSVILLLASCGSLAAAASSWTSNPSVGTTVNSVQYLGCANEVNGRALMEKSFSANTMTIESCAAFCLDNGYPIAGLEYYSQCYCGKELQPGSTVGKSGCNYPCDGNKGQTCGGSNLLSVFNNTNYKAPGPATVSGWTYQSCYMEPKTVRILVNNTQMTDNAMTVEKCTNYCGEKGYPFAGLEYGTECWCGQSMANNVIKADAPGCLMQCDMNCPGNNKNNCGGSNALALYKKNSASKRDEDEDEDEDELVDTTDAEKEEEEEKRTRLLRANRLERFKKIRREQQV